MDDEFIKYLSSLGVGGIIAGFMFFFYRKDVHHFTELWKGQTELLVLVVKENTAASVITAELLRTIREQLERKPSE
jgi:hypothetical protein